MRCAPSHVVRVRLDELADLCEYIDDFVVPDRGQPILILLAVQCGEEAQIDRLQFELRARVVQLSDVMCRVNGHGRSPGTASHMDVATAVGAWVSYSSIREVSVRQRDQDTGSPWFRVFIACVGTCAMRTGMASFPGLRLGIPGSPGPDSSTAPACALHAHS